MTVLHVPEVARPAWEALGRALSDYWPPCTASPDRWQSVEADAVQAATQGCSRCHVLPLCDAYADAAHETAGTWAGVSREPPRQPTKPQGEDEPMIASDDREPTTCPACGADSMGCAVKAGLSGRRCCTDCTHPSATTKETR